MVLLSTDEQTFETTRNAVGEQHALWRVRTAEDAVDQLLTGRCGVLVIDLGTPSLDPVGLVRQVTRQFPDLVVVATGRQSDASLLGGTISEGLVYRFMHKPLSLNRAGMFLDHAIRSHVERRDQSGIVQALLPTVTQLPPRVERRYWFGAAATLLVVVVSLLVYLMQRDGTEGRAGEARAPGAGVPPEVLLPRADAALAAGRLEAPSEDNALDLYGDVLLAQPHHPAARVGLERATGLVLAQAHADSVAGRGDEARRLVRRVLSVDPANPLGLAMQARLETPAPVADAGAEEEPTESFMTLLRREFASARRTTPARPPASRAAARTPPAAVTETSPSPTVTTGSPGAAPLLPPPEPVPLTTDAPTAGTAATVPTTAAALPSANPAGGGPTLVPLREFRRVSTTQPAYPDDARRAGTEGWVRLEFTVNERGQVQDIVVVDAEPRGVFEDAASAALSRWRFRPPVSGDGRPLALRTAVQLRFQLED